MTLTDESEAKIRESCSISLLKTNIEFSIQLLVIMSNLIITITRLLNCIHSLHEKLLVLHIMLL